MARNVKAGKATVTYDWDDSIIDLQIGKAVAAYSTRKGDRLNQVTSILPMVGRGFSIEDIRQAMRHHNGGIMPDLASKGTIERTRRICRAVIGAGDAVQLQGVKAQNFVATLYTIASTVTEAGVGNAVDTYILKGKLTEEEVTRIKAEFKVGRKARPGAVRFGAGADVTEPAEPAAPKKPAISAAVSAEARAVAAARALVDALAALGAGDVSDRLTEALNEVNAVADTVLASAEVNA